MRFRGLLLVLGACSTSSESQQPPPARAAPVPPPVALPPARGEAMEILAFACPGAKGIAASAVEAALRQRAHGLRLCFDRSATATVELGPEGIRSVTAPTPALQTCLAHALRRARIPDELVGATCTIDYQLTR